MKAIFWGRLTAFIVVYLFETGPYYVAPAQLELPMQTRLASNKDLSASVPRVLESKECVTTLYLDWIMFLNTVLCRAEQLRQNVRCQWQWAWQAVLSQLFNHIKVGSVIICPMIMAGWCPLAPSSISDMEFGVRSWLAALGETMMQSGSTLGTFTAIRIGMQC